MVDTVDMDIQGTVGTYKVVLDMDIQDMEVILLVMVAMLDFMELMEDSELMVIMVWVDSEVELTLVTLDMLAMAASMVLTVEDTLVPHTVEVVTSPTI